MDQEGRRVFHSLWRRAVDRGGGRGGREEAEGRWREGADGMEEVGGGGEVEGGDGGPDGKADETRKEGTATGEDQEREEAPEMPCRPPCRALPPPPPPPPQIPPRWQR